MKWQLEFLPPSISLLPFLTFFPLCSDIRQTLSRAHVHKLEALKSRETVGEIQVLVLWRSFFSQHHSTLPPSFPFSAAVFLSNFSLPPSPSFPFLFIGSIRNRAPVKFGKREGGGEGGEGPVEAAEALL